MRCTARETRETAAMDLWDCVVVGGGPAGITAALYLARYNRSVVVADHGSGRSTSHEINENYFGFPEPIAQKELRHRGRAQAERYGATFVDTKIDDISRDGETFVATGEGAERLAGRTLIVATGVRDNLPEFENKDVQDYFGKSLFWCITCDGYKTRGARVAVVGRDDEAATTALQFLDFTDRVTVISNCAEVACEISERKRAHLRDAGVPLLLGEVTHLYGERGMMREVLLDNGDCVALDFMFNLQGARPNSLLARTLGVTIDGAGYIKTDTEQRTNVERVFAAGDVTKAFAHQIVTAAHEGATAAITANFELYRPEQRD